LQQYLQTNDLSITNS